MELREDRQLISISGDIWSENGVSLFAVLMHWISSNWTMEQHLVICEPYGELKHTGECCIVACKLCMCACMMC